MSVYWTKKKGGGLTLYPVDLNLQQVTQAHKHSIFHSDSSVEIF